MTHKLFLCLSVGMYENLIHVSNLFSEDAERKLKMVLKSLR